MQSLSLPQAQKLILLSQGLLSAQQTGNAYQQSVNAMTRLGYVQIDTISVVQRAHHHTLWSRNPAYQRDHLDKMIQQKRVYEYWSHAAAYLAMHDFRFSLPRKQAIKSGQQSHWFTKDNKLMCTVLERIHAEGPLMAKDFTSVATKKTGWETKPAKQALEMLYMQGDLMISKRKNFHKVYDLTERVLPEHINSSLPTPEEHARFLVQNYLGQQGIGQLTEMTYLLKGVKTLVKNALNALCEEGVITEVAVQSARYYTTNDALAQLNKRLKRNQVKILSPFDNLLIQRARTQRLFQFDYLLECYTPAIKRKYGYFCLPILWNGKLVGMMDCKTDKVRQHLQVHHLYLMTTVNHNDDFMEAFEIELTQFATFNQAITVSNYPISLLK